MNCSACGAEFAPKKVWQIFCSAKCRDEKRSQERSERRVVKIRRRNEYLTSNDPCLDDFRTDPELEQKLEWPIVVCRECGQKRASIATTHLRSHKLSFAGYREKWPQAPMLSSATHRAVLRAASKYSTSHPEKMRQNSAKWRHDPANADKLRAQTARREERYHANPEPTRAQQRAWYAKKRDFLAVKRAENRKKIEQFHVLQQQRDRSHRPRKDDLRAKVAKLRSQNLSWGQIRLRLNKETGQTKTANAYRNLLQRQPIA